MFYKEVNTGPWRDSSVGRVGASYALGRWFEPNSRYSFYSYNVSEICYRDIGVPDKHSNIKWVDSSTVR